MRSPTGSHLGKSDLEKYVFEYRFRARIFQRNSLFGGQRHTPLCFNDPLKSVGRFQNQGSLNKYLAKFLRFAEKCCSQRLAITTWGRNTSWHTLLMDKARSNNIFCNNFLFVPPPHKLTNTLQITPKCREWWTFLKPTKIILGEYFWKMAQLLIIESDELSDVWVKRRHTNVYVMHKNLILPCIEIGGCIVGCNCWWQSSS